MKTTKNGSIEFLRFMFAMMILIFHAQVIVKTPNPLFVNGYFGVEFFFIVSGFLMASSAYKSSFSEHQENDVFQFVWKKYKSIFPYHIFAFSLAFVSKVIMGALLLKQIIELLFASIPEFLLIEMAGIGMDMANVNGIEWYVSSMIIATFIMYPFLRKNYKSFVSVTAPLLVLFLTGWLFKENNQTLNATIVWTGLVCKGILRAIAEMALGCICFELSKKLKNENLKRIYRWIVSIVEIACYIAVFYYANSNWDSKIEFGMLFVLAIGVIISFSGQSVFYKLSNNKFTRKNLFV